MSRFWVIFLYNFVLFVNIINGRRECALRSIGDNYGLVCVCNITYCDDLDPLRRESSGIVTVFETNKHGDRFKETKLKFQNVSSENSSQTTITIDRSKRFQEIIGFGGAFTDSVGINIASLPINMGNNIIKDYFSNEGIEYSMGRIPIGGCDYSTHEYTYDDHAGDVNLTHFELTKEDYHYKIPFIDLAKKLSPHNIKLFGSPWSAPAWMKNTSKLTHGGILIGKPGGEYYQIYANYFVKFLDAYKKNGIDLWGITIENEPIFGFDFGFLNLCLGFTPEMERDFLKLNLGPTLEKAGYGPKQLKVMIMDDNRGYTPKDNVVVHIFDFSINMTKWADTVLSDKDAAKYVSGIAVHWYNNEEIPIEIVDKTHKSYPEYFILNTEACFLGFSSETMGDWIKGEAYANDIINDLQHWYSGWVDWNMVLDMKGGPSFNGNALDSPILVNASAREYYKSPMFYVLGHFSKFLIPGSVKIQLKYSHEISEKKLKIIAFERPDNAIVMIAVNSNDEPISFDVNDPTHGVMSTKVSPHAIQSYIWWN